MHVNNDTPENICMTYGMKGNAYPVVNKSTLYTSAYNFMKKPVPKKINGHVKVYIIAFFSKYVEETSEEEIKKAMELIFKGHFIRHLCGCKECVVRGHLLPGTKIENDNDTHYHHIFKTETKIDGNYDNNLYQHLLDTFTLRNNAF